MRSKRIAFLNGTGKVLELDDGEPKQGQRRIEFHTSHCRSVAGTFAARKQTDLRSDFIQDMLVHQTIAPAAVPKLLLSPTSWVDQSNQLRTFCNTRLSINQFTSRRWTMRDDLVQFRQLGVGGIGLWRLKLEEAGERALRDLEESRMKPTSLSFAGGFIGANGMTFKESILDGARCIKLADRVGCPLVLVATGDRGEHVSGHAVKSTVKAIRRLADFAASRDVRLAFMPMRKQYRHLSMISSLDKALDLVRLVDHDAFGLAFHTYHLGDTDNLIDRIPNFADRVFSVHIADRKTENSPNPYRQKCPGAGNLPLKSIIDAFNASGYTGAYELNVWSERLWQADYHRVLAGCVRYLHEHVLLPTPAVS